MSSSLHAALAALGSRMRGSGDLVSASCLSRGGGMVMRSTPASATISSIAYAGSDLPRDGRHDAGMQIVPSCPYFLKYSYIRETQTTPGSNEGSYTSSPPFA